MSALPRPFILPPTVRNRGQVLEFSYGAQVANTVLETGIEGSYCFMKPGAWFVRGRHVRLRHWFTYSTTLQPILSVRLRVDSTLLGSSSPTAGDVLWGEAGTCVNNANQRRGYIECDIIVYGGPNSGGAPGADNTADFRTWGRLNMDYATEATKTDHRDVTGDIYNMSIPPPHKPNGVIGITYEWSVANVANTVRPEFTHWEEFA